MKFKDLDELVSDICSELDNEELLELIKQIDSEVSDYNFTKELRDYFIEEIEDEEDYDVEE